MSGKMGPERKREATSQAPEAPRAQSYTRFKSRGQRDDHLTPTGRNDAGARAPSTLPPPPFEAETDVAGHEWWFEAHMNLASNLLCADSAIAGLSESAAHRARAVAEQAANVRDAMYELYCDAADPRLALAMAASSPITRHIEQLYAWCERVLEAIASARDGLLNREALRVACADIDHLFDDAVRGRIRGEIESLGIDFASPVEPLRNLPKDLEQVFASASALRQAL